MKIEPAMISFYTSFKMAKQKTILSQKNAANLSLFSTSSTWITSGQNTGNSWENLGNVFFFCEINLSISSNCVLTVINASAAVTLLEQRPEKIQALSGIRTHDLCNGSAVLSQLSYQSHMRAVIRGLAL